MTATGTEDGLLTLEIEGVVRNCADAGALVVEAELVGPVPRAFLFSAEALVAVAVRVPHAVLYVGRERWTDREQQRHVARIAEARAVLAADSVDVEEGVSSDVYESTAAAAARLRNAVADAEQELASVRPGNDLDALAQLSLAAGGVVHELTVVSPWAAAAYTALIELADALEALTNPGAGLSDAEQQAHWELRAQEREAAQQARMRELVELGERMVERLMFDRTFQVTAAADRRWQAVVPLFAQELDQTELNQQERGILRPYAEQAYARVRAEVVPDLVAELRVNIGEHAHAVTGTPGWSSATTKEAKRRLAKRYLETVHPLLLAPDVVDELVAAT
jgi:hypothetical protein